MYRITDHRGHVHQSDYLSELIPVAKAMGIRTYFDASENRSFSTGVEECHARRMETAYKLAGILNNKQDREPDTILSVNSNHFLEFLNLCYKSSSKLNQVERTFVESFIGYLLAIIDSPSRNLERSYKAMINKGFKNGAFFIYQLALNKGQLLEDEQKHKEAEIIELFASEIQLETLKNYGIDLDELLKSIE